LIVTPSKNSFFEITKLCEWTSLSTHSNHCVFVARFMQTVLLVPYRNLVRPDSYAFFSDEFLNKSCIPLSPYRLRKESKGKMNLFIALLCTFSFTSLSTHNFPKFLHNKKSQQIHSGYFRISCSKVVKKSPWYLAIGFRTNRYGRIFCISVSVKRYCSCILSSTM
jgi:hypothetical protein